RTQSTALCFVMAATATTAISTLSLHDALPISPRDRGGVQSHREGAAGGRGQGPADQRHSLDEGTPGMIAIVDYGMGNLRSVQKAFERVGFSAAVTSSPEDVRQARGVVVPGVGAFGKAMENLERDRKSTRLNS